MGLLNPGGPIAQFKRNRCSILPVELILQSGVRINNGPKEEKTFVAKSSEKGEKTSIMDRLKSAKAEKPKECCAPQKHKGEIDL